MELRIEELLIVSLRIRASCKSPRICRGPLTVRPLRTSASSAVNLRWKPMTAEAAEARRGVPRHAPNLENVEFWNCGDCGLKSGELVIAYCSFSRENR